MKHHEVINFEPLILLGTNCLYFHKNGIIKVVLEYIFFVPKLVN